MGHYIRFIKNRDLAAENIMTTAVRVRLAILGSPPGCISSLIHRLREISIPLPQRSSIALADEVKTLRGDLPGEFSMQLRSSRRNTMSFVISDTSALPTGVGNLLRSLHHPHTYRPDTSASHKSMIAGTNTSTLCTSCRHVFVYVDHNFKSSTHLCIPSTRGAIGRCVAEWTAVQAG